jgi:hypothetical protein
MENKVLSKKMNICLLVWWVLNILSKFPNQYYYQFDVQENDPTYTDKKIKFLVLLGFYLAIDFCIMALMLVMTDIDWMAYSFFFFGYCCF